MKKNDKLGFEMEPVFSEMKIAQQVFERVQAKLGSYLQDVFQQYENQLNKALIKQQDDTNKILKDYATTYNEFASMYKSDINAILVELNKLRNSKLN